MTSIVKAVPVAMPPPQTKRKGKARPPCLFCDAIARFSFDDARMCNYHFRQLYLALGLEWTD